MQANCSFAPVEIEADELDSTIRRMTNRSLESIECEQKFQPAESGGILSLLAYSNVTCTDGKLHPFKGARIDLSFLTCVM